MGRADELDVAASADLGEVGVLRKEAVAGVNRLDVADLGGADHAVDLEVAVGGFRGADAEGLVGGLQIGRAAIRLAEDRHGLDPQLAAGADDPQGDLTAIGHQNALKHRAAACLPDRHGPALNPDP